MIDRVHRTQPADVPRELAVIDERARALYASELAQTRAPGALAAAVARVPELHRSDPWWLGLGWRMAGPSGWRARYAGRPVLVALLVLALLSAGLLAGSQLHRLPSPFGPARTGQLVFDRSGDIWTVDPGGTDVRRLTAADTDEWGATWSRDGTRIAFWSGPLTSQAELWVMDADGSEARPVVAGPLSVVEQAPAVSWSPDSRRLAFATRDGNLYVVNADGSDLRAIVSAGFSTINTPAWSPDGTLIAFRGSETPGVDAGIYVVRADGTSVDEISVEGYAGGSGAFLLADWAPTGHRLVYSNSAGDIVVADEGPTGWTERVLVSDPVEDLFPAWSPDGKRVSFTRSDDPVMIRIDDPLTNRPAYLQPDSANELWSRVTSSFGHLYVVDAAGGTPSLVTPTEVEMAPGVCWAPDGTTLRARVIVLPPSVPGGAGARPVIVDERSYLIVDVATGRITATIPAPGALALAACSWQRLAS